MYQEIVQIKLVEDIDKTIINNSDKYFIDKELKSVEDKHKVKSLGARYLIKKSILDYLKLDEQYYDIEIENEETGKPVLRYKGEVKKKAAEMNILDFKISISHSGNYISTLVVVEKNV